ncbi:hypothetical protein NDU88_004467 [Pleurodeles waltl]|uniref:Uncharacterized protein n=1 Tax=Pleurodeles waltl TaxID=8319 RepID=A0AAV7PFU5_PLEWA|nr:hypothetical protein NDU88_004467 [Pleurodeles waltl]
MRPHRMLLSELRTGAGQYLVFFRQWGPINNARTCWTQSECVGARMAAAVPHIALRGLDCPMLRRPLEWRKWRLTADEKASDICGGHWGATADHTDTIYPVRVYTIAQRYPASGYPRREAKRCQAEFPAIPYHGAVGDRRC